jgi:CheY-like chemotaxis protein
LLLVVDDEESVRDMVAQVLRRQGYTVLEAENGGEALKVAEEIAQNRITLDLLFTDMVMPIMGGRELSYRLKASQSVVRVLYTSGYADTGAVNYGPLQADAQFILKPFTPDALARKVRDVLDR